MKIMNLKHLAVLVLLAGILLLQLGFKTKDTDRLNNIPTITIGNQVWMQNNLDVTTYRNGDPIPQVTDPGKWANLTSGAWCWYENNSALGVTYGKLYNWYAVNDPRGLAPAGFHVPSNDDWITLKYYLGGPDIAGGKMKETGTTHWRDPNEEASNSSGFTGLPAGYRNELGSFYNVGFYGYWWTSTTERMQTAYHDYISFNTGSAAGTKINCKSGLSVRCIKD